MTIAGATLMAACGPRTGVVKTTSDPRAKSATATHEQPKPASPTGDARLTNAAVTLGRAPPEINASDWLNSDRPVALRDQGGRTVLISFCRLYDAQCEEGRQVLLDLYERHSTHGFLVVELFVDRPSAKSKDWEHYAQMRTAIRMMNLPYPAGFGERVTHTELRYGVHEVPAAYLVDADGKLVWAGRPAADEASLRRAVETIAGRAPI